VGPRAVLDAVVKRKIPSSRRESNRRTPIVQPVAQREIIKNNFNLFSLLVSYFISRRFLKCIGYIATNMTMTERCIRKDVERCNDCLFCRERLSKIMKTNAVACLSAKNSKRYSVKFRMFCMSKKTHW
jgi:hypothetical protein